MISVQLSHKGIVRRFLFQRREQRPATRYRDTNSRNDETQRHTLKLATKPSLKFSYLRFNGIEACDRQAAG